MGLDQTANRDCVWTHEVVREEPVDSIWSTLLSISLLLLIMLPLGKRKGEVWEYVLYGLAILFLAGLAFDIREVVRTKGSIWTKRVRKNTYTYRIGTNDGDLVCQIRINGWRYPFSFDRIALDQVWGIKNTGYELRVMRKGNYDVAFSICTTQFADLDAKADFMKHMESLGKKVLGRAADPSDYIYDDERGTVTT